MWHSRNVWSAIRSPVSSGNDALQALDAVEAQAADQALHDLLGRVVVLAVAVVGIDRSGLDDAFPRVAEVHRLVDADARGPHGHQRTGATSPHADLEHRPRHVLQLTDQAPQLVAPPDVDQGVGLDLLIAPDEVAVGPPWCVGRDREGHLVRARLDRPAPDERQGHALGDRVARLAGQPGVVGQEGRHCYSFVTTRGRARVVAMMVPCSTRVKANSWAPVIRMPSPVTARWFGMVLAWASRKSPRT